MSDDYMPRSGARWLPDRRHVLAVLLGIVFAVAVHQIWALEGRWFYVVIIAVLGLSAAMFLIGVFSDFLLICLMFAIPVAGFGKWFFPDNLRSAVWSSANHNATLEGTLGLGLIDFILAGLLMSWLYRIFVLREERLPSLNAVDVFALIFLLSYVISIPGSPKVNLGLHATAYLLKFILLYFYVSRNLKRRHLWWFVVSLVFAVALESSLGLIQHTTGKLVGLGLDKGSGSALEYQYQVPGTESWFRATGTLYDSHTLGLYLAMISPFMFVLSFARFVKPLMKVIFAGSLVLAMAVLLATFTRSAWVASAVSMSLLVLASLFVWKDRQVVPLLVFALFVLIVAAPWWLDLVILRFEHSPVETISTRFEGYDVGLYIWSLYPLFGLGAGNYMEALYQHSYGWNQDVIVHNTIIWIGSEVGILGLVGFYGAIIAATRRAWRIGKSPHDLVGRCGFAIVFALIAFVVEGMATPMHREPATYTMFWFLLAMTVALQRMRQLQEAENREMSALSPEPPERR